MLFLLVYHDEHLDFSTGIFITSVIEDRLMVEWNRVRVYIMKNHAITSCLYFTPSPSTQTRPSRR